MDVKTAGRTVEIFENFAETRVPMTLSEIARVLDAPQSSCFNLVRALEARGYLYSVGGSKRVYPTRKLLDIAQAIVGNESIVPRVAPLLEQLRNESRETVILAALQPTTVIYLAVTEGSQTIRYSSTAGALKPIHASASGKALLMAMTPEQRTKLVLKLKLIRTTPATLTKPEDLLADIAACEARGYAITRGENVDDVMGISMPIEIEKVIYAVCMSGPIARMEANLGGHVAQLRHVLRSILWAR